MSGMTGGEPTSGDRPSMNKPLATSCMDGEEPTSEAFVDPSRSADSIDDDDDWVIVKKQRITILIPPPSPEAASPQAGAPKISSRQTGLIGMSSRDYNAARKTHPNQLTTKKCQDSSLEGIEFGGNGKNAQANSSGRIDRQDVPRMRGEIFSHSSAPAVKSEWTNHADHAVQGPFHQGTSSFGNDEQGLPIVTSHVANKVMRARLLQRRVAGFGGLRNWLRTRGLGWFVKILDCEKLGMYQVVSLTMNQLKEMGLVAIGPRRKLIHAIDSLCQPHQFEMFT